MFKKLFRKNNVFYKKTKRKNIVVYTVLNCLKITELTIFEAYKNYVVLVAEESTVLGSFMQ